MSSIHKNRPAFCFSLKMISSLILTALTSLFCAGCLVIPIRSRAPTRGASAETREQVNLDFILQGVTTREEIAQRLAWMNTDVKEDRLFIGRWFDSNWGFGWIAASYYTAASGWNRKWNNHNLLVEFDAGGLVQQYRVLPDQKLAAELSNWAAQTPDRPLDLSRPIEVLANVDTEPNQFLLGSDSFERRELQGKGKRNFSVAPSQIVSLSLSSLISGCGGSAHGSDPNPHTLCLTFHFRPKTRAGRKLTIQADMPTVVLLFRYFAQTRR